MLGNAYKNNKEIFLLYLLCSEGKGVGLGRGGCFVLLFSLHGREMFASLAPTNTIKGLNCFHFFPI